MTTPPPYGQDPYQQQPPPSYPTSGVPQPPQYPGYPVSGGSQSPPYPSSGGPQPYPGSGGPQAYPGSGGPQPGYPSSGGPQPYSPYGGGYAQYDPVTGQPYSDKTKVAAGLLQLLPGFFMGLGGIGRLYAGYTTLGVTQLVVSVVGWVSFWCGFFLLVPFLVFIGTWLWAVIDGIILLAGRPADAQGRLLR